MEDKVKLFSFFFQKKVTDAFILYTEMIAEGTGGHHENRQNNEQSPLKNVRANIAKSKEGRNSLHSTNV